MNMTVTSYHMWIWCTCVHMLH